MNKKEKIQFLQNGDNHYIGMITEDFSPFKKGEIVQLWFSQLITGLCYTYGKNDYISFLVPASKIFVVGEI